MSTREEILTRIDAEETEIVNLYRGLVQIPSENPPGDTREIAKFLVSLLERICP